jgi:hypothetical protein
MLTLRCPLFHFVVVANYMSSPILHSPRCNSGQSLTILFSTDLTDEAGEEVKVIEERGDDRTPMKGDSSGGVNHPFILHPSFISGVITRAQKVSHQDHNPSKSRIGD